VTTYGITSTGFEIPTALEILAAMEADERAALGSDLDTSPEQPLGQMNGIVSAKMRELWEAMATVYNARVPSGANLGVLDDLCALSGVTRKAATRGTVTLSVTLAAGRTLPIGSVASVVGQPGNQWRTTEAAVNASGSPAVVSVRAEAVLTGVYQAASGAISVIATPVSGWTGVTNAADATAGRAIETDPELRARREQEYQTGGNSPADAIRSDLSALSGVTQVVVFENTTLATDADGLPAKSVEALVLGGTTQTIGETLWRAKAAGIETYGSTAVTVVDVSGVGRVVHFTRPTARNIYVEVFPVIDPALYGGAAGEAAIKAAILEAGNALLAGEPVRVARLSQKVMGVRGVVDVLSIAVGFSPSTLGTSNLSIALRERAVFDTGRITVTPTTPGT
jgi:uncharacterized phage protein gp47/JayE